MDLQELYRAIPKDRELVLSHNALGIFFRVIDRRAGADIERVFLLRLRDMNATLDKELSGAHRGER